MYWWSNVETKERRRSTRRPAGFGWILAPSQEATSDDGDSILPDADYSGSEAFIEGVATVRRLKKLQSKTLSTETVQTHLIKLRNEALEKLTKLSQEADKVRERIVFIDKQIH